jgi:Putative transposase
MAVLRRPSGYGEIVDFQSPRSRRSLGVGGLSLPIEIRYRMSYDKQLISKVLAVFLRVIQGWYRNKAMELGFCNLQGGSVSFIQKFGSSLNATPHYHCLLLDGGYTFSDDTDDPIFVVTPPPSDEDVKQIAETVAARALRLLEKRGVIGEQDLYDPFSEENPLLAGMTAASVRGMIATGERAGLSVRRVLSDPARGVRTSPLCYVSRGFSLHAARRIEAYDRNGLEQLCSYVTRPPLAAGSLEKVGDDRYRFKLKTSWSDGTSYIILSGHELLEKLAAIVPPPRANTTRYHGVLAPHAEQRAKVVPAKSNGNEPSEERTKSGSTKYRLTWAALLARVFKFQVDVCPECGGRMRIIAFLTDPASVQRYLRGEGLPTEAPTIAQARPPPQMEFEY